MTTCNRCGKCCYIYDDKGKHKCKHLVILSNGKTLCRIYNKRLGQLTGYGDARCFEREVVRKNYSNCPFNKEDHGGNEDEKTRL